MKQQQYKRLAPDGSATVDAASRVVRYVFSDESVGRDGHIVKADAWQTDNFEANPVFLWFHMDETPPIGRVFDLHTQSRQLLGAVKYAETEFADSIYQLVKDGYLNATSCSWLPIAYVPRSGGGGGVIFTSVDLLEISQVGVPSLPTALAQAGARGLNLRPLANWAERALDTKNCQAAPRLQIEAIFRAARPRTVTAADRRLRAREIIAKGERMETVRKIKERITREDAG
jgi:phage head maturation protease